MSLKKKNLTAVMLRWILIGCLVLLTAAGGASYYFGNKMLSKAVLETNHAKSDAEITSNSLTRLQQLQTILESKEEAIKEAQKVVGEIEKYQYQDQIIDDINRFASKSGVSVTGFDFGTAQAVQSPTTPGVTIAGVATKEVNITLKEPLSFESYMRFIKAIENNLTKMQVTGISLTPSGANADMITNSSIGITVYVKG